jgi:hypothetical protein
LLNVRDSGSRPKFPIRMTLLTLPAIALSSWPRHSYKPSATAVQ